MEGMGKHKSIQIDHSRNHREGQARGTTALKLPGEEVQLSRVVKYLEIALHTLLTWN